MIITAMIKTLQYTEKLQYNIYRRIYFIGNNIY